MFIKQIYTKCLAQACYYIESAGEAAIIDPLRDIEPYLELLKSRNARLKYIFETHFHADFVGGHIDLAEKTSAEIVFGPGAQPAYKALIAKDKERFKIGDTEMELLHTPGHTLESCCLVLYDADNPYCIFTGDTLFLGDVGRPDLVQKVKKEITPQMLAGQLYDSLHQKIMTLPDATIIYPGHGAGSACGKHISNETTDTLGNQKKFNYALNTALSKEEFIEMVVSGLTEPPNYFPQNVLRNLNGSKIDIDTLVAHSFRAIDAKQLQQICKENKKLVVLDTRSKEEFCAGHITNSIFIGLDDNFAPWVGTLIEGLDTTLILVADIGREKEAILRLSRVGYDNCIGYLAGSLHQWQAEGLSIESVECTTADTFAKLLKTNPRLQYLDVRRQNEYQQSHLQGAINIPLNYLERNLSQLDPAKPLYIHCAGGYRSVIAISILKRNRFKHLINILGGFTALRQTDLPVLQEAVEVIDI